MGISLNDVQRGYERWAAKPHNAKWVRKIDGTPIANDIVVNIFEALKDRPPETAVKVRELEWREDWGGSLEDIPEWRAKTPWGSITVSVAGHRDAGGNRYERHSDVSEELYRRLIGTAQADYERRILSALVPSDALKELGKGDGR